MTELLNSYTFEAKKIVYYSVTVGANNKTCLLYTSQSPRDS